MNLGVIALCHIDMSFVAFYVTSNVF